MDKLEKAKEQLKILNSKLALARKANKTIQIGILEMRINALNNKITRLSKGEKTKAGKVIQEIKKAVVKKKDTVN
tara:strand:- start:226 stop:450 length:225 start_codon:yes stop_codon:yes gene_type:complete